MLLQQVTITSPPPPPPHPPLPSLPPFFFEKSDSRTPCCDLLTCCSVLQLLHCCPTFRSACLRWADDMEARLEGFSFLPHNPRLLNPLSGFKVAARTCLVMCRVFSHPCLNFPLPVLPTLTLTVTRQTVSTAVGPLSPLAHVPNFQANATAQGQSARAASVTQQIHHGAQEQTAAVRRHAAARCT